MQGALAGHLRPGLSCEAPERSAMTGEIGIAGIALALFACGAHDSRSPADGGTSIDSGDSGDDRAQDAPDSPDPTFCVRSGECIVRPADCCQADCGANAIVVLNGVGARDFAKSCLDRGCTPCRVSGRWVPQCVDGRCTITDLDASPHSACRADADCRLRWGAICCEKCHPDPAFDLVSVSRSAEFCGVGDSCDPCALQPYPATARAVCVDEHCKVQP